MGQQPQPAGGRNGLTRMPTTPLNGVFQNKSPEPVITLPAEICQKQSPPNESRGSLWPRRPRAEQKKQQILAEKVKVRYK